MRKPSQIVPFSSQPDREMQATLASSWRWKEPALGAGLLSLSSVPTSCYIYMFASQEREIGN